MKRIRHILSIHSLLTTLAIAQPNSIPPDLSGNYRYAYSADGFNQDRDDVAGSAMAVALFDRAGKSDQLVHFHFNTNFGGAPSHAQEHRKSALQTAVLFGMISDENGVDAFFDVSRSPQERLDAISHLAQQMKNSTEGDPLMVICAGGVQTPYLALSQAIDEGATAEALRSLTFFSHGKANENTLRQESKNPDYHNNWHSLKKRSPTSVYIDHSSPLTNGRRNGGVQHDQNSTAWNQGPRGNRGQGVKEWMWLADYGAPVKGFGFSGTKGEWLLTRLKAAGAPEIGHNGNAEGDASDAGMVFALMGGPTDANMNEIRTFFMNNSNTGTEPKEFYPAFAHTVFFWLKNPDSADDRKAFETSLRKFLDNSKYAKTGFIGYPPAASREVVDGSFTFSLIATFESAETQALYQKEEAHEIFIKEAADLWSKVIVYDSATAETQR